MRKKRQLKEVTTQLMVRQHLCTAAKMKDKWQAKVQAQTQRGRSAFGEVRVDQVRVLVSKACMERWRYASPPVELATDAGDLSTVVSQHDWRMRKIQIAIGRNQTNVLRAISLQLIDLERDEGLCGGKHPFREDQNLLHRAPSCFAKTARYAPRTL
jgi:hypothetical protein